MKNISKLILGVSAFAFSQTANAAIFQPAGVYTLSGTVTVEKDLAPLECELACVIQRIARESWREWRKHLFCCRKLGA